MKLSIIVTLYNNKEYLNECLCSLEKQAVDDCEVIIVDDGSTDDPFEIIEGFLLRNHSWRYCRHENHGVGYTRNRGLLLARGEFISFVDSDDYILDTMYQELLAVAERDNACVVLSNFSKISSKSGGEILDRKDKYIELSKLSAKERVGLVFGGKIFGMVCCSIIKRSLYYKTGIYFPANVYHEDIYVLPKIYKEAAVVSSSENKGYIWRLREDSESHSINARHITSVVHALLDHKKYLERCGDYRTIEKEYTGYCIMYLNGLYRRISASRYAIELKEYLFDLLKSAVQIILKDKARYVQVYKSSYKEIVSLFEKSEKEPPKPIVNALRISPKASLACDVAFFPHKLYHTKTMLPIAKALRKKGYACIFIDMSEVYGDEGAYSDFEAGSFPVFSYERLEENGVSYCASVFMNDWDVKCALPTVIQDNASGVATFGIVEGIQDFWDADTGRHRNAYQSVRYLIASGEHDLRHFANGTHKEVFIGGVPRLEPLLVQRAQESEGCVALINSNFTYGVLEDERSDWVRSAVQAAEQAGFKAVITRHPQDRGDLAGYEVTGDDMYQAIAKSAVLISRFSSAIIEAICLGKPAINYNPSIENVDKFKFDLQAFYNCGDFEELKSALIEIKTARLDKGERLYSDRVRDRAREFLRYHCAIGVPGANPEGIASFIGKKIGLYGREYLVREGSEESLVASNSAFDESFMIQLSSLDAAGRRALRECLSAFVGRSGESMGHLFSDGNKAFRESRYGKALLIYLDLIEKEELDIYRENARMAARRLGICGAMSIKEIKERLVLAQAAGRLKF